MPTTWIQRDLPLVAGGVDTDGAATLKGARVRSLRNALIRGAGRLEQQADFLQTDACKNGSAEVHAVCGIFPFAVQGGASAASAGVAFSHDLTANKILLHQLGESRTILRSFDCYTSFPDVVPQVTGFEMYGKFYVNAYSKETVANRKGMAVFDPTTTGTITIPTYDLVSGGAAAAALRFRGIAKHRGATIIGWGYRNEETAGVDAPECLRYCKYGDPATWVADTTPTSAGFFNVGTLGLPVVACAESGPYTILGKQSEVFALEGDYSALFGYGRNLGSHGPLSTVGMVSIGSLAVWLAEAGPAASENGGLIQLLGVDRITRRFLSYLDLTTAWGTHDSRRHRVLWGLRRKDTEDGAAESSAYLTELLWWDYQRNEFGTSTPPGAIFSLGTIRGRDSTLAGPSGVVSAITASGVHATVATVSWTPGDSSSDVTFELQYRINGTTTWVSAGTFAPPTKTVTGLAEGTVYDVRVAQIRNAQYSAWVTSASLFTTTTGLNIQDPTNAVIEETGRTYTSKGVTYCELSASWDTFSAPDTHVVLYTWHADLADPSTGDRIAQAYPEAGEVSDPTFQPVGTARYYWLRHEADEDPDDVSNFVDCIPQPITPVGAV